MTRLEWVVYIGMPLDLDRRLTPDLERQLNQGYMNYMQSYQEHRWRMEEMGAASEPILRDAALKWETEAEDESAPEAVLPDDEETFVSQMARFLVDTGHLWLIPDGDTYFDKFREDGLRNQPRLVDLLDAFEDELRHRFRRAYREAHRIVVEEGLTPRIKPGRWL
jgi:hypothetical protein